MWRMRFCRLNRHMAILTVCDRLPATKPQETIHLVKDCRLGAVLRMRHLEIVRIQRTPSRTIRQLGTGAAICRV